MTRVVLDRPANTRLEAATTLEEMRKLVHQQLTDPLVWETARKIVANVAPRDELDQSSAIRDWCVKHFQFVNDPLWSQLLTSPTYLLQHITRDGYAQGNCADAAMLTAALNAAVHIPCRFCAVAFHSDKAPYSHVFTIAYPHTSIGSVAAVEQDITRPPGLKKAGFTRRMLKDV